MNKVIDKVKNMMQRIELIDEVIFRRTIAKKILLMKLNKYLVVDKNNAKSN